MENNRACDLYSCKQIKISEYEKSFTLSLIVEAHVLLEHKEVVFQIRVSAAIYYTISGLIWVQYFSLSKITIS